MSTLTTKSSFGKLISRGRIQRLADEIARKSHPLKVILFGSYATGKATADSDVDILVVTRRQQRSWPILRAIQYDFALDLLVLGEKAFRERLEEGDFFLMDVTEQGQVLYEENHGSLGRKG